MIEDSKTSTKPFSTSEQIQTTSETPFEKARISLDQLFLQAQGQEWRDRYVAALSDVKPVLGGDPAAIRAYAGLVCEHVEKLNSLIKRPRSHLFPVSRSRFAWPVLKSKHPFLPKTKKGFSRLLKLGMSRGGILPRIVGIDLVGESRCWWMNWCGGWTGARTIYGLQACRGHHSSRFIPGIFEQPRSLSRQTYAMKASQLEMTIPVAVCAWCKPKELGTGVGTVSHGICPRHLRNIQLQMHGHPVKPLRRITAKSFKSESLLF